MLFYVILNPNGYQLTEVRREEICKQKKTEINNKIVYN